jgi:hypothetical protein
MDIKNLLLKDFGVNLPISGGLGNSIDNPIIIHREGLNDYVGTEYTVLKFVGQSRGVKWEKTGQELISYNGRRIDQIKIKTEVTTDEEIITQEENYYFDITDCFNTKLNIEVEFDEIKILAQIIERIRALENINDFNRKCIGLLRKEQLLNNTELFIEFLDVIFNDESFPLFKRMLTHRKIPIMNVLRMIAPQL